jgi:hypothetical protein
MAGNWSVIQRKATVNRINNPSFERNVTDGWSLAGGARAWTGTGFRGAHHCLQLAGGAGVDSILTSNVYSLANGDSVSCSAWEYRISAGIDGYIEVYDNTNGVTRGHTHVSAVDALFWQPVTIGWTNDHGHAVDVCVRLVNVERDGASNIAWDAVQMEMIAGLTSTYCDGDQNGCEWLGVEHNSHSRRSLESLAGGIVYDLAATYFFSVEQVAGVGVGPVDLAVEPYAVLTGGEVTAVKEQPREFVLAGTITGTSLANLHANRQALLKVLRPARAGEQPITLRYTGVVGDVVSGNPTYREIECYYAGGLDGQISAEWTGIAALEKVQVRFIAGNPNFTAGRDFATLLDTNDTGASRLFLARLRSNGQWSVAGPPGVPGTAVYNGILAMAVGPDGKIYFGGDFDNFDNQATCDNIAVYDPLLNTYAPVGGGLNDTVNALVFGPDGYLYAAGLFINAGGIAAADFIARIRPTDAVPAWSALTGAAAGGAVGEIIALCFGRDGLLYIGGNFAAWGDANGNYITSWNGAALVSLGTGMSGSTLLVEAIVCHPNGDIYAGGQFHSAGGVANTEHLARWTTADVWESLHPTEPDNNVKSLAMTNFGKLYLSGDFHNAGGVACLHVAAYQGGQYEALGSGIDQPAVFNCLNIAPDGMVYVTGGVTIAGGIPVGSFAARWNGTSWNPIDLTLPAGAGLWPVVFRVDPVVSTLYDVYVGAGAPTGTAQFGGKVVFSQWGTAPAYPTIRVARSGGTTARLRTIRNERTARELVFNYLLLDGEALTIYLEPTRKRIVSSLFGDRPDAVLPNCDFGAFTLEPSGTDEQIVTAFVDVTGAPTITAEMWWRVQMRSLD